MRPARHERLNMLDDVKHSEPLKLWLTEREFIDLCRTAAKDDRKPGEMARVMVRRFMYGTIGAQESPVNETNRAD